MDTSAAPYVKPPKRIAKWEGAFIHWLLKQADGDTPEVRMWAAVLVQGVKGAVRFSRRVKPTQAQANFTSDHDDHLFVKEPSRHAGMCAAIGINPRAFQTKALAVVEAYGGGT